MKQDVKRLALFASGNGSNVENIVNYFQDISNIETSLVLTNKKDAFVIERAKNMGVQTYVFSAKDLKETDRVLVKLEENNIDYIVLAGFLLKVPSNIIDAFPNRIINIHPALLPKYGGKGMYGDYVHQAVKEAGETETGISIHLVNEAYDEGQIVFQAQFPVLGDDTPETIAEKVHILEYKHFPEVIEMIVTNSQD